MFPKPSARMRRLRDAFFPGDSRPLSPAMCCGWGSVPPELRLPHDREQDQLATAHRAGISQSGRPTEGRLPARARAPRGGT